MLYNDGNKWKKKMQQTQDIYGNQSELIIMDMG